MGDTYLDPMMLFGPVDLAAVVHLAPTGVRRARRANRASGAACSTGLANGVHAVGHAAHVAVDATGLVSVAWDEAAGGLVAVGRGVRRVANEALPLQMAARRGVAEWWAQLGHCDAHAPPADGTGGSDHRVMVVAGIDSSRTAGGPSLALPTRKLGYRSGEVSYFSYANHGTDYTPSDTEGPLLRRRATRRATARARARDPGGRSI